MLVIGLSVGSYRDKYSSVTSLSSGPSGLSVFRELGEALYPGSIIDRRKPILEEPDLNAVDAYLLLSPRFAVTEREAGFLKSYLQNGGILIASFHSEQTYSALRPLFRVLKLDIEIDSVKSFKNYRIMKAAGSSSVPFFEESKEYGVYASKHFVSDACPSPGSEASRVPIDCFVRYQQIGRGQLLLFSGIPPLSNGLIGYGGNPHLALSVLRNAMRLTIDEYRHFFSEKTFSDLLAEPVFTAPILTLVLAALLFLLFGDSDVPESASQKTRRKKAVHYHDFGANVIRGLLGGKRGLESAVALHQRFLMQLFPARAAEISEICRQHSGPEQQLQAGEKLFLLHRCEWQKRRGGAAF